MSRKKSNYQDADLAYMASLSSAVVQRSPRYLMMTLLAMVMFVLAAVLWMGQAQIDVVVRGAGKVIPSQQLQVLQSLEGGVVSEILVNEGEVVEIGQELVKLSDVAFAGSYEENRLRYLELLANIARLKAEADEGEFVADEQLATESPELLQAAERLYETRREQLTQTVGILEEKVSQNEAELREARARARQLARELSLSREELELKEPLVARGLVTRVELLQLRKQENETAGELEAIKLSIPRYESTINESKGKIEQTRLDFRNQAREELSDAVAEASRIAESRAALEDRVSRTVIRSPVKGTITRLHVNTIGGVVSPGGPVMEIVPYEDALLVQVEIEPKDVANISVGQLARLKFTAYDFAIHGSLEGELAFLSADTVTENDGTSHYVARIKPEQSYLGQHNRKLPIRVGMTAEADIVTNKKTILEYLLKPVNRGLERAMREI